MDHKQRLKAAQLILQQLSMHRRRTLTTAFERLRTPTCSAGDFHALARQFEKAVSLRRDNAARQLLARIGRSAHSLQRQLYDLSSTLIHREPPMPLLREIWEDLEQLEQEFSRCEFTPGSSSTAGQLKVTVEDISLQGTYLGPFQIVLDLHAMARLERRPYRVVALDPQPSQRDSDTVHPHISDERLCEGDAANAIRSCLETGRIAEFCLVVRSVLSTYNAASAYVSLGLKLLSAVRRRHELL